MRTAAHATETGGAKAASDAVIAEAQTVQKQAVDEFFTYVAGTIAGRAGTREAIAVGAFGTVLAGVATWRMHRIPSYEGDPLAQEALETPVPVSAR